MKVTKAGLTRIESFMNNIDQDTSDIEELKLRLNKLEELWKSLIDIQIDLSVLDENMTDEQLEQDLEMYEEKYIKSKLVGERILKARVRPAVVNNDLDQAVGVTYNLRR
ncbi:nucleic-acid binding [Lasius niger]|uniref:Nucleic-acid binding n=1 Tax=Lasius niger TaxID=67767 RepID=A0A0J7KD29_LASNI|nr:nucleic-acid binding [Lasius niger]